MKRQMRNKQCQGESGRQVGEGGQQGGALWCGAACGETGRGL